MAEKTFFHYVSIFMNFVFRYNLRECCPTFTPSWDALPSWVYPGGETSYP
jgi:hypothetical protein